MTDRPTLWTDLPHLIPQALVHATIASVRPTVSYRALDLGADAGAIGLIGGAFAALSLVAAIPIGQRIDRSGERVFFLAGAAVLAASTIAAALAGAVVVLALSQALLGLGFLCTGLAIQTVTAGGAPELRVQRFARIAVAASAGQFAGPLMAGAILERRDGILGLGATAAVFWLATILVVVAALIGWRAPAWRHGAATRGGAPASFSASMAMVRIPGMRQALAASIAVLTTLDLLVAYLPVLGEDTGISPAFIGLVLSVQAAAGVASRVAVSRLVRRFGRRTTLAAHLSLAGLGLVGLALVPPRPVLLVLGAVIGFGLGLGLPITTAWVSDQAPEGRVGAALALRLAGNRLGALTGPPAIGLLAGVIGTPAVFVAASLGLFGSAWWARGAPGGSDGAD